MVGEVKDIPSVFRNKKDLFEFVDMMAPIRTSVRIRLFHQTSAKENAIRRGGLYKSGLLYQKLR